MRHGGVEKSVKLVAGMSVGELCAALKAAFRLERDVVGLRDPSRDAVLPLSLVVSGSPELEEAFRGRSLELLLEEKEDGEAEEEEAEAEAGLHGPTEGAAAAHPPARPPPRPSLAAAAQTVGIVRNVLSLHKVKLDDLLSRFPFVALVGPPRRALTGSRARARPVPQGVRRAGRPGPRALSGRVRRRAVGPGAGGA